MALPQLITVSGRIESSPGDGAEGASVKFKRTGFMAHTDGTVISPEVVTAVTDANGDFSVDLPASDDPDWSPTATPYVVTVDASPALPPFKFTTGIPHDVSGGGITLGELMASILPPEALLGVVIDGNVLRFNNVVSLPTLDEDGQIHAEFVTGLSTRITAAQTTADDAADAASDAQATATGAASAADAAQGAADDAHTAATAAQTSADEANLAAGAAQATADTAQDTANAAGVAAAAAQATADARETPAGAQAKADAAYAAARQRANHTGTQAISTVSGLQGALDSKADLVGGVIPTSQIPALAINDTFPVTSQAAMLALTAQRGDVAVRTDLTPNRVFLLTADAPGTLANWKEITAAGSVVTVNGQSGAVTLGKGDVGLGSVDNVSAAQLRDRSTHTGTQSADTVVDGTTNKAYTAVEKTKLAGVATGATVNSSDSVLINRANHTGTQPHTTITGLGTAVTRAVGTGAGQLIEADATVPDPPPGITGDRRLIPRLYVASRGDNLFVNGSGLMGTNYNMSGFTFDRDTHGGDGSFLANVNRQSKMSDEYINVDPTKGYTISLWVRAGDADGSNYNPANIQSAGVALFDADNLSLDYLHRVKYAGSADTTLALPLNTGDSTMTLVDATGWANGAAGTSRAFAWWPYVNALGYSYPVYSYSRNTSHNSILRPEYGSGTGAPGTWPQGGIVGNVVTLTAPWTGPTLPAGTPIQNVGNGGTYLYSLYASAALSNQWTRYTCSFYGLNQQKFSQRDNVLFAPGTAKMRLLWLVNYHNAADTNVRYSDITVTEHGAIAEDLSARGRTLGAGTHFLMGISNRLNEAVGVYYLNASAGPITVVLPSPSLGPLNPMKLSFVRTDNSANAVLFSREASPTLIQGNPTLSGHMTTRYSSRTFVHDGTDWYITGGFGS